MKSKGLAEGSRDGRSRGDAPNKGSKGGDPRANRWLRRDGGQGGARGAGARGGELVSEGAGAAGAEKGTMGKKLGCGSYRRRAKKPIEGLRGLVDLFGFVVLLLVPIFQQWSYHYDDVVVEGAVGANGGTAKVNGEEGGAREAARANEGGVTGAAGANEGGRPSKRTEEGTGEWRLAATMG